MRRLPLRQQTNPVERQVSNPITDTPNINPVSAEQNITAPNSKKLKPSFASEGGDGEVVVYSESQTVEGEKGRRIIKHSGNVDLHYGIYRLQANEITIYEAENKVVASGSVIFDQGDDQRITGASGGLELQDQARSFRGLDRFYKSNQRRHRDLFYGRTRRTRRA